MVLNHLKILLGITGLRYSSCSIAIARSVILIATDLSEENDTDFNTKMQAETKTMWCVEWAQMR